MIKDLLLMYLSLFPKESIILVQNILSLPSFQTKGNICMSFKWHGWVGYQKTGVKLSKSKPPSLHDFFLLFFVCINTHVFDGEMGLFYWWNGGTCL